MKTVRAIGWLSCGLVMAVLLNACVTNRSQISLGQLDAFMEQWSAYEPFKAPMDSKDEPLLLAALEKDPNGPWARYVSLKFSQSKFKARDLDQADRAAHYRETLGYLVPARDILAEAVKAEPSDLELQGMLSGIEEKISLVALETGVDLEKVEADSRAALAEKEGKQSWNSGNKIFKQHTKLGRVALRKGDIEEAKKQLLASGHTPGSPQLNSFGPDFTLARELAEKGEFETVLEFLDLVAVFWANPGERTRDLSKRVANDHLKLLNEWKKELNAGRIPDHRKWK